MLKRYDIEVSISCATKITQKTRIYVKAAICTS